jgi:glycosyltransferase involved in cell wall biosynthesis
VVADAATEARGDPLVRPLEGAHICLVFEHSLLHCTRLRLEITALEDAGATVQLLTSHSVPEDAPRSVPRTYSPLLPSGVIGGPKSRWRPLRTVENLARNVVRPMLYQEGVWCLARARVQDLQRIGDGTDLLWVIDYPSLPTAMKAAKKTRMAVLYETLDLVPDFDYLGRWHQRRSQRGERRLIGRVDGFITVCDSYADYYAERYAKTGLQRRPVVRNDMPGKIMTSIRATARPLKMLFLGSLMFDRPVHELIRAMAQISSDITLTFQGENHLGQAPTEQIAELRLTDRVRIMEPCPPEDIVEVASSYDVGIVALRGEGENERRASTTKIFTYMAAGLLVLGSNLPGIAPIVIEHKNGILVRGMDPAAWSTAIDSLNSLSDVEIDAMKQDSLDAAQEYSWERQRPAFIGEFVRALAHGGMPLTASSS